MSAPPVAPAPALALPDVLECLPCGVFVTDADGRLGAHNRPATLLLRQGAARGELLLEAVRPEARPPLARLLDELLTQGFATPSTIPLDVGDGLTVPAGLSGTLARGPDGAPSGLVVVVQDMTAHEELARRQRLEASRKDLISETAHEAMNPMAAILGHLDLASSGPPCPCRGAVDRAKNAATRLHRLMSDLLDDTRVGNAVVVLRREPTRLSDLVGEVVAMIQAKATKGLRFEVAIPDDLPVVQADPDRLLRVVSNLVDNAAKYSPDGGLVRVSARVVDRTVELAVADRGMGISAEDLPRLFERHFRPKQRIVRALPGTGLGLSIVKTLVEAHGGAITVESAPGQGTTFRVRLPLGG